MVLLNGDSVSLFGIGYASISLREELATFILSIRTEQRSDDASFFIKFINNRLEFRIRHSSYIRESVRPADVDA